MYDQVEKPKENRSRTVANSVAQKKSNGKQGFGFVDNRPERIVQKKLAELVIGDRNAYSTQKKTINPEIPNSFQKKHKTLVDYQPKDIAKCNTLEIGGCRSKCSQELGSQDSMEDTHQHSTIIQMVQYNNIESEYDKLIKKHKLVEDLKNSTVLDSFFYEEEGTYDKRKKVHEANRNYEVTSRLDALEKLLNWKPGNRDPDLENLEDVSSDDIGKIKKVTDIPTEDSNVISELELDLPNRMEFLTNVLGDNADSGAKFKSYVDTLIQEYNKIYDDVKPAMEDMGAETKENNWQMSVKVLGADAHGALGPMHITLKNPVEDKIGEFIYKPRPGNVDKLVMDMFKELNKVEREGKPKLPVYEQKVTGKGFLLSEVVKGETATKVNGSLDNVIKDLEKYEEKLGWSAEDVKRVKKQLMYIDTVAKKIGLTDLHNDNLIVDPETKEVVPIDLESIIKPTEEGINTGLYGDDLSLEESPLNEEEQQIIADMSKKIDVAEYRVVPLATSRFNEWLTNQEVTNNEIIIELGKSLDNKWGIEIDKEMMKSYLEQSRKLKIIPYFINKDKELHSGSNVQVGKRKSNK